MRSKQREGAALAASALLGLCCLLAVVSSVSAIAGRLAATALPSDPLRALAAASRYDPLEWLYPYKLGDLLQRMGRREAAADFYQRALARNRACALCWIGLAEVAQATGRDPLPFLRGAVRYGRANTLVRKRAAVVYAMMGKRDEAVREFRAALAGRITNRFDFYALLLRIFSLDEVLESVVPDSALESLFAFARHRLPPAATRRVWERCQHAGKVSARMRDAYVAYLLGRGLVSEARQVGFEGAAQVPDGLIDPGFEGAQTPPRLGWNLAETEGVKVEIAACPDCPRGKRALRVAFDGEHNPAFFGVRQFVPVTPGARYRLSALVKSQHISSAQGPSLFVSGAQGRPGDPTEACKLYAWSEDVRLTTGWHEIAVEFEVPRACRGIRVHVARRPTKKLNRFIGGELWVDEVRLQRLPVLPEQPSEKAGASARARAPRAWGAASRRHHGAAGQESRGCIFDQLASVRTYHLGCSGQRLAQARGPAVAGMRVGCQHVREPKGEQSLSTAFCPPPPKTQQRVRV